MSSVFGAIEGGTLAVGVGEGAAAAIEPSFEPLKQEAWAKKTPRIQDLNELAALVAQRLLEPADVQDYAHRNGFGDDKLDYAIQLALRAPPLAEVLILWRRGRFGVVDPANPPEQVTHALAKEQIEAQYWPAVLDLFFERLSMDDVAVMVQRGIVPNPGWLPVGPPTETGRVPPMPQAQFDPVAEALSQGFDQDRAAAKAKIIGLPASPDLAARMTFRGIIDPVDFDRAIAEGNTRNEWAPFLFDGFREILTAHDYCELQLRGYLNADQRRELTAQHGMSDANSDLLYDVLGRGINVHQVLIGQRRGGTFQGSTADIPPEYLYALERGNLRPEVYNLAYAARETYPSYFVTRALAQAGVISPERTKELFEGLGWPLDVADAAATFYTGAGGTSTGSHVTKAETQLWTAIHKSYVNGQADDAFTEATLAELGVSADEIPKILSLWRAERNVIRRSLTPAEIKKAIGQPGLDQAWALERLQELGYTSADASAFLAE